MDYLLFRLQAKGGGSVNPIKVASLTRLCPAQILPKIQTRAEVAIKPHAKLSIIDEAIYPVKGFHSTAKDLVTC